MMVDTNGFEPPTITQPDTNTETRLGTYRETKGATPCRRP